MSEQFEESPVMPATEIGLGEVKPDASAGSLFDSLRARRDEIANTKTTTIPIAGYEENGLEAQYRLMERSEVEELGKVVIRETKDRNERVMLILVDTITASLDGFVVREKGKTEPTPLYTPSGLPVNSWTTLVLELGGNPADDREAVYWIFGNNEFAIGQHAILLNRWMGNTSLDIEQELGEGL